MKDEEERHLALQQGSRQERWQVGGSLGIGGEALEEGRATRSGELWENSLDQVELHTAIFKIIRNYAMSYKKAKLCKI